MSQLKDFQVLRSLRVDHLELSRKRVQARYTAVREDGSEASTDLIYSYEADLFNPEDPADLNLASMMVAQIALNYGLFCREIVLEGLYDKADESLLRYMLENTSREILTGKLLAPNPFLKPGYQPLEAGRQKRYTQATLVITPEAKKEIHSPYPTPDYGRYAILSSGGKDSLLTYGLVRELGEAHPVYINEAGRHWFTAVNAYRYFKANEPRTAKPWCNSDRVFTFMLKQLPFIREDFASVRADIYPIRLWTVAVFLFGVLPLALNRGVGNILIGDEYDTTVRGNTQGISHYSGLYDQSRFFDNAFTRYYRQKGWHLRQYSMLRSLSELLIMKVLTKRYPDLQALQVSCHAAHEAEGIMKPCGKCEKCRRIIGMMVALDADPAHCGYTPSQIEEGLRQLASRSIKQIGSDAAHLYHLLREKGALPDTAHVRKLARHHPEILKLRFDSGRSLLEDLPPEVREPLFRILRQYATGTVIRTPKGWQGLDLDQHLKTQPKYTPYAVQS
ncbi:hypothetical protein [Robiginitalea sediminis]|uniref:hypothetical protein n=1 Tax=Robiginitalea sediminis TaxID=1982593 RepID=UPI00117B9074|nr:hypothetical protein [Robiginitalea sediminis]